MSSESTPSRSWVSDEAGFGCAFGMADPYQANCGGVAGGMSLHFAPPLSPRLQGCVSGELQSSR